jgi:hypothetical protein
MNGGPEYSRVELPLVEQLKGLGWTHIEGSKSDPGVTGITVAVFRRVAALPLSVTPVF